ncbi:MAG: alanine dehydrogenase [Armatimonadetes bacterium]|nr:alanine dehydrogenase [Armatimonadota bacterium]
MIVGIPREIKDGENRVAITPAGVSALVAHGHTVLVEQGAGVSSGFDDAEYVACGATIAPTAAETWLRAEMVVKVKEPLESEWPYLRDDLVLFTYLHLASSRALTEAMLQSGVRGVAYETVQRTDGSLPLLEPMSEVAGRIAVQAGMFYLMANNGGRGILLSGVPGVPPAEVLVLGCGIVGFNAATLAVGLGAQVTVMDVKHEPLKYLDDIMHGRCITVYSTRANVARAAAYADLVIGAVLVAGARAPVVMDEAMVAAMRPGSVVVDVAVDQGGCIATTRPTSMSEPVYTRHGVLHYCVPNMPALVPRTSTYALTNATLPYVLAIADDGLEGAVGRDPALRLGLNTVGGRLTCPAVAEAFDLPYEPWAPGVGAGNQA